MDDLHENLLLTNLDFLEKLPGSHVSLPKNKLPFGGVKNLCVFNLSRVFLHLLFGG